MVFQSMLLYVGLQSRTDWLQKIEWLNGGLMGMFSVLFAELVLSQGIICSSNVLLLTEFGVSCLGAVRFIDRWEIGQLS